MTKLSPSQSYQWTEILDADVSVLGRSKAGLIVGGTFIGSVTFGKATLTSKATSPVGFLIKRLLP